MTGAQISIVTAAVVVVLVFLFIMTTKRRDSQLETETKKVLVASNAAEVEATSERANDGESKEVAEWVAPTAEAIGVSRRQFFNRSIVAMFAVGLSGFGGACLAFLWPNKSTGFGLPIKAGNISDILDYIAVNKQPFYVPEGRVYIAAYDVKNVGKAAAVPAYNVKTMGMDHGIVALYQKCVHLGCRVPWCKSSQWFECPCHGSRYNRVGEKKGGPAPRGLDRFGVSIKGDELTVNTGDIHLGPPIGTNTTGQEAEGPHC